MPRRFADRIYWLFDTPEGVHQAACRRAALVREAAFRGVPELARALEQLEGAKFPKLMAYLDSSVGRRVRTNNHLEQTNRLFRFLENVRFKWRRRRTLIRFVVLQLDAIWSRETRSGAEPVSSPRSVHRLLSGGDDRTVRLWDVATGHELRRFSGHEAEVNGVAFLPDARRAPEAATTSRCAFGISGRDERSAGSISPARSNAWRFRPTAGVRPSDAMTRPCGSGSCRNDPMIP